MPAETSEEISDQAFFRDTAHRAPCRKEGTMKCAHLFKQKILSSCKALEQPYMPSIFQLAEYCKTTDHKKCPFYLKGIIREKRTGADARAAV